MERKMSIDVIKRFHFDLDIWYIVQYYALDAKLRWMISMQITVYNCLRAL